MSSDVIYVQNFLFRVREAGKREKIRRSCRIFLKLRVKEDFFFLRIVSLVVLIKILTIFTKKKNSINSVLPPDHPVLYTSGS